jgi:DNA polymerase-3 subunit gamma/tau
MQLDKTGQNPLQAPPDAKARGYRVLARKYRPTTFAELIGQDALVRTLTNALTSGRLAQAYMLSGVRGVGKTTTARILARALNCVGSDGLGGVTAQPCGVCVHCRAIAEDRHLDVIEMDGATHTGKDEIRELLDGVRYRPTTGRFKVYIIDEVHMLSEKAFNALLKTLEEPPSHVRFVFATTEVRKVPVTVLSRCQRFDLRRVDAAVIGRHLRDVAQRERAEVSAEAVRLIARAADGSVRDGLSLLDQALALASGHPVDAVMVRDMLGLADRGRIFDLADRLFAGDAAAALAEFAALHTDGADPLTVLEDLLELVHWLARLKVTPTLAEGQDVAEAERVRGQAMAGRLNIAEIGRAWQLLLKGLGEVRVAPQPQAAAEMVLIRFCYASTLPTPAEALRHLSQPAAGKVAASVPADAAKRRPAGQPWSAASLAEAPRLVASIEDEAASSMAPVQPPTETRLCRFEDVIELAAQHREIILKAQLMDDVRLVSFQQGRIALRLTDTAPRDLPQRLSRFLTDRTGQRWLVSVSEEEGAATLTEQQRAAAAARLAQVLAHPLVQAVMQHFPGAQLEGLRTAEAAFEVAFVGSEGNGGDLLLELDAEGETRADE